MRAAWYDETGSAAKVLKIGELPTPEAGPSEVRVRLAASGVNPADVKLRSGLSSYGYRFPRVILTAMVQASLIKWAAMLTRVCWASGSGFSTAKDLAGLLGLQLSTLRLMQIWSPHYQTRYLSKRGQRLVSQR